VLRQANRLGVSPIPDLPALTQKTEKLRTFRRSTPLMPRLYKMSRGRSPVLPNGRLARLAQRELLAQQNKLTVFGPPQVIGV
jgi:hypothetical protein